MVQDSRNLIHVSCILVISWSLADSLSSFLACRTTHLPICIRWKDLGIWVHGSNLLQDFPGTWYHPANMPMCLQVSCPPYDWLHPIECVFWVGWTAFVCWLEPSLRSKNRKREKYSTSPKQHPKYPNRSTRNTSADPVVARGDRRPRP